MVALLRMIYFFSIERDHNQSNHEYFIWHEPKLYRIIQINIFINIIGAVGSVCHIELSSVYDLFLFQLCIMYYFNKCRPNCPYLDGRFCMGIFFSVEKNVLGKSICFPSRPRLLLPSQKNVRLFIYSSTIAARRCRKESFPRFELMSSSVISVMHPL